MKITIARQCGSGGHKVADILSEKLGMEIFDKKRFIEESKRRNVYDENNNFDTYNSLTPNWYYKVLR
jgi:cytidylate kinase